MKPQRHPDGADGASLKHSVLACCNYGLLAPEVLAGNPDSVEPQGSGDNPEDTMGAGGTDRRETGTGERNGQRAARQRARKRSEDPLKVSARLTRASNKGERGG